MAKETIIRETSIGLGEVRHIYARGRNLKFEIVYAVGNTAIDLRKVIAIDLAGNRNDITEYCHFEKRTLGNAIKDCVLYQMGWK